MERGFGPATGGGGWRTYAMVFRVSLIERMTYRADFLLGTFLRFVPVLTTVLLWRAIYDGAAARSGATRLANFSYEEMMAYLLLVNISRMFSSMPGLAGGIARDVREGTLKKYLLQPLDMLRYLLAYRVAHKITYMIASFVPYAVLFLICRDFFRGLVPTDGAIWVAYLLSLVLAFLIGFAFEAAVGMVGFWLLEVTSILYIVMTLNFFVSGHMFPLDLIPGFWGHVLQALPFKYMAYFPAMVFLGKVQGADLWWGLAIEAAWAAGFWILARWLYVRGLKRYSAFGG
jgi:ABC-2 type transport system permease protein